MAKSTKSRPAATEELQEKPRTPEFIKVGDVKMVPRPTNLALRRDAFSITTAYKNFATKQMGGTKFPTLPLPENYENEKDYQEAMREYSAKAVEIAAQANQFMFSFLLEDDNITEVITKFYEPESVAQIDFESTDNEYLDEIILAATNALTGFFVGSRNLMSASS